MAGHIIACHVDESGGMAELAEAERLLAAAYGPGAWVPATQDCRECQERKHGACNGVALIDEGHEVLEVDCICASQGHRTEAKS